QLRVAGAAADQQAIVLLVLQVIVVGDALHAHAALYQVADDAFLAAAIQDDNRAGSLAVFLRRFTTHLFDDLVTFRVPDLDGLAGLLELAKHRAAFAQVLGQRPRVHPHQGGDVVLLEPVGEAAERLPVAVLAAVIADDQ